MMLGHTLWNIGHYTRQIDQILNLMRAYKIRLLIDVRTIPRSRYNPQFNSDSLAKSAADADIGYRHAAALGGLRKAMKDSINMGWRNASFRGYADYMQTNEFWNALEELMAESRLRPTAIMCAEALPWRCHRSLIADAVLSRAWTVRHIMSLDKADDHKLTPFAAIDRGKLIYPASIDPTADPRLF